MARTKSNKLEERNYRMFLDYVKGATIGEIAEKYNLSPSSVMSISSREGWKERKFKNGADATTIFNTQFINIAEQMVEEFYKNDYEAYSLVIEMLHDKEALLDKNGHLSIYKLEKVIDCMIKLEDRIKDLTGIVKPSELLKAQVEMVRNNIGSDDLIEDNFLAALNWTANKNFGEEITTNNVTELNNENERED